MTYLLRTQTKKLLADTLTPVSIYLRLRDKFANSILLESSDYHGNDNSFSYICCHPIASFSVVSNEILQQFPDGTRENRQIISREEVLTALNQFIAKFKVSEIGHPFITNGLFGYMAYDAVGFFEDIELKQQDKRIPDVVYNVYRYVIVVDHFKNELHLFDNFSSEGEDGLEQLETLIRINNDPQYEFTAINGETSNYTDPEFLKIIEKGISHCLRGDVFQIVLSRRFESQFQGDEFNVYRALRSINPSPYLFYFDYGSYKIFGSSPESQIVVRDHEASIFPIAGTFRRTGDDAADAQLAQQLAQDEKENSEHVMLVDLARNDLSRSSTEVHVDVFKEVQYYSHVIHLVSKVTGKLNAETPPLQMVVDTFPAGTLSGAPKHRAMQLIDQYENTSRGYYGGAIGFMGFNGDFNHAIMIRSFLSSSNTLHYQAGAGIVAKSNPESELQEVNNKLAALRHAIEMAETIK